MKEFHGIVGGLAEMIGHQRNCSNEVGRKSKVKVKSLGEVSGKAESRWEWDRSKAIEPMVM